MNSSIFYLMMGFLFIWTILWLLSLVLSIHEMRERHFLARDVVTYLFLIFITFGLVFPFVFTHKDESL